MFFKAKLLFVLRPVQDTQTQYGYHVEFFNVKPGRM
jgi:hypothetical protein